MLFLAIVNVFVLTNSNVYYAKKLVRAIREENIEEVKFILDKRPKAVNTYPSFFPRAVIVIFDYAPYSFPLQEAQWMKNEEIIELLIENGAKP